MIPKQKTIYRRQNRRIEKQIQRDVLYYLHVIGVMAWSVNSGCFSIGDRFVRVFQDYRGQSISGIPDIMGYTKKGRAIYIEIKKPGGRLTDNQKAFIENAQKVGCLAIVAYSILDIEKHKKELECT
jgi:hypothetical protein